MVNEKAMSFSFTSGRRTTDGMFMLRTLYEENSAKEMKLYMLFLYLVKAVDKERVTSLAVHYTRRESDFFGCTLHKERV